MKSRSFHDLLAKSPLFHGLEAENLTNLYEMFEHDFVVSGEYLVHQGDPGDCMFLVLSGRLQALITAEDGEERVVDEMGRGDTVGEMAMITGEARAASVRAARDSELARLSKAQFDALVQAHPGVLMHISQVLIRRLTNQSSKNGAETFSTLAVVPSSPNAPMAAFLENFIPLLAEQGSLLRLDRAAFDAALGEGAALDDVDIWDDTDGRIANWFTDQEQDYRFVIFEADPEDTPWTRRCLRQADRALLVARADDVPTLTPAERLLFDPEPFTYVTPAELVLLHPNAHTLPSGTAAWLAERPVVRHHHVHLGTVSHLQRVIRFLRNRAVGVVLGGGGAKGSAHFGVLRALEEAGIPIDMIGGTSSGAAIAAQYAQGGDLDGMRDESHRLLVERDPFRKLVIPMVSFVSEKTVDDLAVALYGDRQIEDMWIPYFCVSCNLSTGATVVHRSGPAWKAVRATSALPGIFAPMVDRHQLLVDGGVIDNVPVAIMKRLSPGPVIVVNVSADEDLVLPEEWKAFPSPWTMLRRWLNPFTKTLKVPNIMSILARVVLINSVARKKETMAMADFFLQPPVSDFGLMESKGLDSLIKIGYEYTVPEIRRWRDDPELAAKLPFAENGGGRG